MLQQTLSFWRRFVGATPNYQTDETASTTLKDERRLWVRYSADSETQVQLTESEGAGCVVGRIRDISLGGAKLVVDREFRAGQMLTLDLASLDGEEVQSVLACVVRVAPDDAGQWSLGCVFSRPLVNEDLEKLGTKPTRPSANEQRTWTRHSCNLKAQYQRIGDPDEKTHPAQILNISGNGIGLSLTHHVEVGSLLHLDLLNSGGEPLRTILACVVHSSERAGSAQAVGCNFIRALGEDELNSLL